MDIKFPVKQVVTVIITIVAVVLVFFLKSMFYTVESNEQAVVLTLGKYTHTSGEGLHFKLPYPLQTVFIVNVTGIRRSEIGFSSASDKSERINRKVEAKMLTADENIVNIEMEVQYRIKDPKNFLFNIEDPSSTLKSSAESALRVVVGQSRIDSILTTGKAGVMFKVQKHLQEILDFYKSGIDVVSVQLPKVNAPTEVIDAFQEVQRAKEDKMTMINQAIGYSNSVVPVARGGARKMILKAEGYSSRTVSRAEGDTEHFKKLREKYAKAPSIIKKKMHLEALEEILPGKKKYLVYEDKSSSFLNFLDLKK
ncbi:MAG: FtsH protease activity modulator HflK [Fibrobacterota bacterium]